MESSCKQFDPLACCRVRLGCQSNRRTSSTRHLAVPSVCSLVLVSSCLLGPVAVVLLLGKVTVVILLVV